jgi:O-antigen ligase
LLASGRVIALGTVSFAAAAAVLGVLFLGSSRFVELLLGLVQRSASLTGRTNLWRLALEQGAASPLWGQGFGLTPDYSGVSHANHAHNGFIQVFFDRGLVGVLIFMVIFAAAFWAAVRRKDRTGVALITAVAVANLANDYLTFASLGLLVLLWQSFLGSVGRPGWLTRLAAGPRGSARTREDTQGVRQGSSD